MHRLSKNTLRSIVRILALMLGPHVAAEPDVPWRTVDGGGVMRSNGGELELSGTIGQHDAGFMAGGGFELTGGFWFELRPGDCNEDAIVSVLDHSSIADCLSGPGTELPRMDCLCYDLNRDKAVDLRDFGFFQRSLR
jgi:hypothetical protein